MKNIKKKSNKKVLVFALAIVIIIALLATYLFIFKGEILGFSIKNDSKSSKTNSKSATKQQKKAGEKAKKETIDSESNNKPNQGSDQPPSVQPPTGGETKSTVSMIVSAANQNGSTVQIRLLIQSLVSSGTCTLSGSSPSGKSIQKSAAVQPQSSTSTCMGFDIPVSELSQEDWSFKINFENNDTKGSADTKVSVR